MPKELNKFILNGEEIDVADSSAREAAEEAESLANVANAKAEAVDAELTRQVGILDNKIESVDDKADNYYNTLDNKIDTQGSALESEINTLDTTLTAKINIQGVPSGGTDGQILAKDGNTNYATKWVTQAQPQPAESEIDDSITANNRTWSSSKISSELGSVGSTLLNDSATASNSTWSSSKISSELGSVGTNLINDSTTANNKTWSSSKISSEIQGAVISEIDDSVTASNKTWSSQKINSADSNLLTKINNTQEITAPQNSAGTASKTYNAGDYLIRNDTLYKATTTIAQGATLTVGVNIEATDVATELNSIKGGSGMPTLDWGNPIKRFNTISSPDTYTATEDCYVVGWCGIGTQVVPVSQSLTNNYVTINDEPCGFYNYLNGVYAWIVPLTKLKAGDVVKYRQNVTSGGWSQPLFILKEV